jgi:hypothetical protein
MRAAHTRRSIVMTAFVLASLAAQDPGQAPHAIATGATWQRIELPRVVGATAPEVTSTPRGALLTWLEPIDAAKPRSFALQLRHFREGRFDAPTRVHEGDTLFVNWADFPSAIVAGDGSLFAHWLRRGKRGHYGIELAHKTAQQDAFTSLGNPHRDGIVGEHGFVSMLPEPGGVRLFWLDGRHYEAHRRMELRCTTVVGDTFGDEEVLDPDVCTCCQTSAVMTSKGPLVVYRGHTAGEVRDIMIVRRDGAGWTTARTVNDDGWVFPGCPVNGPAVAGAGAKVAVVWYTGAAAGAGIKLSLSTDAGATFSPPLWIDREDPLGRVDIAATDRGFVLVWFAAGEHGAVLRSQEWLAEGGLATAVEVAQVPASRQSGFPRLAAVPGGTLLVWTEADGLRAARLPSR